LLIDSISFIIIGIIGIFSMLTDTVAYLESILLIGILAFLSTIALCRFIERGVVIERKRDR
jgi:multicomponent Na+:H+ antiporter subunit F